MNRIVVDVPGMYGDHHVLQVRQSLLDMQGVSGVAASGAQRKVAVTFDEAVTSAAAIRAGLEAAGYPSENGKAHEYPKRHEDGSSWYEVAGRTRTTEAKDREMSGDHRRY